MLMYVFCNKMKVAEISVNISPRKGEKIEIEGIRYKVLDVIYNIKNSVILSIDLMVYKI